MTRIIDNDNLALGNALSEALRSAYGFDACIGYFNLRGWRTVRDAIDEMESTPTDEDRPPVRLLIGMAMAPSEELRTALEEPQQRIDRATAAKRVEAAVLDFARQLVWGTPNMAEFRAHCLR